jgi:hypothetical protein
MKIEIVRVTTFVVDIPESTPIDQIQEIAAEKCMLGLSIESEDESWQMLDEPKTSTTIQLIDTCTNPYAYWYCDIPDWLWDPRDALELQGRIATMVRVPPDVEDYINRHMDAFERPFDIQVYL